MSVRVIDRGWERIKRELKVADGSYVKVGFPEEKSSKHSDSGLDVSAVAAFQEFGTSRIPARPFMAQSFDKHRGNIDRFKERELSSIYAGGQTVSGALDTLGVFFTGKVKETIGSGDFAPNAPSTIAQKGSSTPLIDTGQMRATVDYEVKIA